MKLSLVDAVTIVSVIGAACVTVGVVWNQVNDLDARVAKIEDDDKTVELKQLRWEFERLRCEMHNIQHVLKNQPEKDC